MLDMPHVDTADSREGFSKGDRVKRVGGHTLPPDGVVQGWSTLEYSPDVWRCTVTWGGRHIAQYKADEVEHDDRPQ